MYTEVHKFILVLWKWRRIMNFEYETDNQRKIPTARTLCRLKSYRGEDRVGVNRNCKSELQNYCYIFPGCASAFLNLNESFKWKFEACFKYVKTNILNVLNLTLCLRYQGDSIHSFTTRYCYLHNIWQYSEKLWSLHNNSAPNYLPQIFRNVIILKHFIRNTMLDIVYCLKYILF